MRFFDSVHSSFEVTSPLALELIETKAFQRLKRISQFGLPGPYYHLPNFSRFEHTLGVYTLLERSGASEEEQVAGLLHDISHTAFSHLVDWVLGDSLKEDYQDKRHLQVLKQSEIANILSKHGFLVESLADYSQFRLLERDLPELCADRIDYSLREAPKAIVDRCFPHIVAQDNTFVFDETESALVFATYFLDRQMNHWAGYETITRYVIFSDMLKLALREEIIEVDDFFQTDDYVIDKLKKSSNQHCLSVLLLLKKPNLSFLPRSKNRTRKKFRYVDPLVVNDGKTVRLSKLHSEFANKLHESKKANAQGICAGYMDIIATS